MDNSSKLLKPLVANPIYQMVTIALPMVHYCGYYLGILEPYTQGHGLNKENVFITISRSLHQMKHLKLNFQRKPQLFYHLRFKKIKATILSTQKLILKTQTT
jgi:hypothetical protein